MHCESCVRLQGNVVLQPRRAPGPSPFLHAAACRTMSCGTRCSVAVRGGRRGAPATEVRVMPEFSAGGRSTTEAAEEGAAEEGAGAMVAPAAAVARAVAVAAGV